MRLTPPLFAAGCFVLAASTTVLRAPAPQEPPRVPPVLSPAAVEPPAALVSQGDTAPDFAWHGPDGRELRLHDLRAQGHVLIVVAPDADQLRALQDERERLLDLHVVPAAVLDRREGAVRALGRRLGLAYTLIPDPQRIIADQFNALDPSTRHAAPAWFIVDRTGHVRALDRSGLPAGGYARLASSALALPSPGTTIPSSAH